MPLGGFIIIAALGPIIGLCLHLFDTPQNIRIPGLPADVLATADFTNDLVHYAQALYSPQLQDFVPAVETFGFDEDYTIVTIGHIYENYQDAMNLKTSVDFSDCEPLFDKLWYYRPDDQSPNEGDEAALKAVIKGFVHHTAIETVERCIRSMYFAMQQHTYLRKLHGATRLWVRKTKETDVADGHIDIGDNRSHKFTAGVTYLSIMLEVWTQESYGLREFLAEI